MVGPQHHISLVPLHTHANTGPRSPRSPPARPAPLGPAPDPPLPNTGWALDYWKISAGLSFALSSNDKGPTPLMIHQFARRLRRGREGKDFLFKPDKVCGENLRPYIFRIPLSPQGFLKRLQTSVAKAQEDHNLTFMDAPSPAEQPPAAAEPATAGPARKVKSRGKRRKKAGW